MTKSVFLLKNINSYRDGSQYFCVDPYPSEDLAFAQMADEFESFFKDDFDSNEAIEVKEIGDTYAELRDGDRVSTWEIEERQLDFD